MSSVALDGVAPPGWEKTVLKMKKSGAVDNPFALAWWLQRQGAHPAKHETAHDAASLESAAARTIPAICYAAARGEARAQATLLGATGRALHGGNG